MALIRSAEQLKDCASFATVHSLGSDLNLAKICERVTSLSIGTLITRGSTVGSVETMYDGSLQPDDVAGPSDGDGDGGDCCAENDLEIPIRFVLLIAPIRF